MTAMGLVDRNSNTLLSISGELPRPPALRDDPEALRAAALKLRLDLLAGEAKVAAAKRYSRSQAAARWISDLSVGYERERETDAPTRRGPRASVAIPLFNSGKDRVLRATAEHE